MNKIPASVVFLLALAVGLALLPGVPWTDDARFYVPAAQAYAEWFTQVFDGSAFTRQAIDAAFAHNHEHPPVAKYAMGLGWLLLHKWTGLLEPITAARVPVVMLWAWCVALVFRLLDTRVSRFAAVVGAIAFVTMPRMMFHGHAETLDLPVTAFILAASEAFLRSLEAPNKRNIVATILFFTLALGTKLNAPFALVAMTLFALLWTPPKRDGLFVRLGAIPWAWVGMVAIAPLLVWLLWPWLWFDTSARLAGYLQFHLRHYPILFYYAGTLYKDQLAPWSAPWIMLAITTPLPVFLLALTGFLKLGRLRQLTRLHDNPALRLTVFATLMALTQLIAVSLPNVPVYGGIKLFLAATPFVAVLAGVGFATVHQRWLSQKPRLAVVVAALVLLPGCVAILSYRGAWLSYYSEAIGGVWGAQKLGFETQYYDLAYPEIVQALNQALPNGGTVAILPNPKEYTSYLARWQSSGELKPGIRTSSPAQADVLLLTHEMRWPEYSKLLERYEEKPLLYQHSVFSVPLFSVYKLN